MSYILLEEVRSHLAIILLGEGYEVSILSEAVDHHQYAFLSLKPGQGFHETHGDVPSRPCGDGKWYQVPRQLGGFIFFPLADNTFFDEFLNVNLEAVPPELSQDMLEVLFTPSRLVVGVW